MTGRYRALPIEHGERHSHRCAPATGGRNDDGKAVTVDHAHVMTGMDHHGDLADKVEELIAAAQQAEQRRVGS